MRAPSLAAAALVAAAGCASYPDDPYEGVYEREYRAAAGMPVPIAADAFLFRGYDGRYYCRRGDGSLGLAVFADGRHLRGEMIWPRRYKRLSEVIADAGEAGAQLQGLHCA